MIKFWHPLNIKRYILVLMSITLSCFMLGNDDFTSTNSGINREIVKLKSDGVLFAVRIHDFPLRQIMMSEHYYHLNKPISLITKDSPVDNTGVPVTIRDGKKYNHPVRLAQHTIYMVNSYHMTKNNQYLKKAKLYAQRLYDISIKKHEALYFPYDYGFSLHSIKTEQLKPKWYSGMSQGQALSALVYLYKATQDSKYLNWAHKVYNSLAHIKTKKDHLWVSMVDNKHYLWIEEYPLPTSTHVLNGFIFSVFGLYDYYQLTGREDVKRLLQASLTTIYDHLHLYRVPNDISRYGLKHTHQSRPYHLVHIKQLDVLHRITGDAYFNKVSNYFESDLRKSGK